jgi:putative FmdB family regulatory protein
MMPIYEYRCSACGHRFEFLLPRHDAIAPGCPACGTESVERVPSVFAVGEPIRETGSCGTDACACRRAG